MKRLLVAVLGFCLSACAPIKSLSPADRTQVTDVVVTIAPRFEDLTVDCKGIGCVGILYGPREPGSRAELTRSYRRVGPGAFDLVAREVRAQLESRGVRVLSVEQTRFVALPKAPDLLQSAKVRGSMVLHLQVWDFGISKTGSTDYQPNVSLGAYLVRREGAELLYSQLYNFGPEAGGKVVNLGSTDIRFRSTPVAQSEPGKLAQGLAAGVRNTVNRIVSDIAR